MTPVSESPDTQTDPASEATTADLMQGFEAAVANLGNPVDPVGTPEPPVSVETSETVEEPDTAKEPPAEPEPAATEDPPDPEQTINFDGFEDDQRTLFEQLHKDGHMTPDQIEGVRKTTLRQSVWTKKTMSLADDRKAWEAEKAQTEGDLEKLAQIRSQPHLLDAWDRLMSGEFDGEDAGDDDDLVDRKTAREEARSVLQAEREAEAATKAQQEQQYLAKETVVRALIADAIVELGVDAKTMQDYLETEGALIPKDVDPILQIPPDEWKRRLVARHELETAQAEIVSLREQATKRTSKEARTAKQSLPPSPRIAEHDTKMSPLQRVNEELGLDSGWSQVQGFGNPEPR